jgi:SPP1 gp7 family putative phage head morphogenesis protein
LIGQINDLYSQHCEDCGGFISHDLSDGSHNDWDDIYKKIAEELLKNKDIKINANLHLKTAEQLIKAVSDGFGYIDPSDDDRKKLISKLKQNIYAFSAAKSFTQMQYYRDMMIGENGNILSTASFMKKIADTGEIFNKIQLTTESENAHYSAIMADKWDRFAEDDYLQYSTVGDSRVRPSHAVLDKHTAPKSDGFWKSNYPPNGWSCRCTVIPGKENHQNRLNRQEAGKQLKEENKDTPFYNNVGLSKVIFKDNHPYFINAGGKEQNLSWQQYGLPNMDKIRSNELPDFKPTTKDEYLEWWKNYPRKKEGDILIKDIIGNDIILDSSAGKKGRATDYFKEHIIRKEQDKRFEYGTEAEKLLKSPDEIWVNPLDKNVKTYLKYYEAGTLKLVVNENNKAETMFLIEKIDNAESTKIGKSRKGILLYK